MMPLLILASCQNNKKVEGVVKADMDLSVAPGADFYQYANGGWMKNNPLRPEYARFGAFDYLSEENEKNLNDLFQEMASLETTREPWTRRLPTSTRWQWILPDLTQRASNP